MGKNKVTINRDKFICIDIYVYIYIYIYIYMYMLTFQKNVKNYLQCVIHELICIMLDILGLCSQIFPEDDDNNNSKGFSSN